MTEYAQMSNFQVVRPFDGFEAVYQGQAGTIPIAFPGTPDPLAGRPRYADNLIAGIPTPLGSRVALMIPMTVDLYTCEPVYTYQIAWRTRNQQAYTDAMQLGLKQPAGYHLIGDVPGRNEHQGTPSSALYFMPGASDIEIFEDAQPTGEGAATLSVRQQIYFPRMASSWAQPLLPNGQAAIWQQGAYQYSSDPNNGGPTWFPIWIDACGDEMIILAYKIALDEQPVAAWDFAGADKAFSNTYGTNDGGLPNNPNIGILVATGSMGGG